MEQLEQLEEAVPEKPARKPAPILPPGLRRRLLAGAMAFLLIFSMAMGYAVQIRFAQLSFVGTVAEHAAAVTAENTEYLSESTLERAWKVLRYAVGKPKTYDEYEMYASLAIAKTDYAAAAEYLQGCIDTYDGGSDQAEAVLYLRLGSLFALTEKYPDAISAFDRALTIYPDLPDAYLLRAQMHSMAGNTDLAKEDVASYDALAGDSPTIRASIGSLYESVGDYENAIACYTEGLSQQEDSAELYASRARCLILQERLNEAKPDLLRYFQYGGEDADGSMRTLLGLCYMNEGDFEKAIREFHSALKREPENATTLYGQCVLCAYAIGDFETVLQDGQEAAKRMESSSEDQLTGADGSELSLAELYQWMALARMAKEDFSGAKTDLENSAAAGDVENNSYYLGLCCAAENDYGQAAEHFTQSIEKNEMVSLCYYNRGVCYLQDAEKVEQGLTDFITVLERNDDADAVASSVDLLRSFGVEVKYQE